MYKGGWCGLLIFRDIIIVSVILGLKDTSQFLAQSEIISRSVFSRRAAVSGCSTTIYKDVSSAKSLIFDPISETIALIYNRNRSGPQTDP